MSEMVSKPAASDQTSRQSWGTQYGFLIAAIGSAIGLGNIWRFPGVAYQNGGGAFIVPYLIALLAIGLPMLMLDYAIGHKFRGSPPLALARVNRRTEAVGWWQVGVCFFIVVYYAAIIAWALRYTVFSLPALGEMIRQDSFPTSSCRRRTLPLFRLPRYGGLRCL